MLLHNPARIESVASVARRVTLVEGDNPAAGTAVDQAAGGATVIQPLSFLLVDRAPANRPITAAAQPCVKHVKSAAVSRTRRPVSRRRAIVRPEHEQRENEVGDADGRGGWLSICRLGPRAVHGPRRTWRVPRNPYRNGDWTGSHLLLKSGDVRTDVNVALERWRAITVRVVDDDGEPLAGLRISITSADSGRDFNPGWLRQTDDRGRLRVFKLPPGRYIACAEPGSSSNFSIAGPSGVNVCCEPAIPPRQRPQKRNRYVSSSRTSKISKSVCGVAARSRSPEPYSTARRDRGIGRHGFFKQVRAKQLLRHW